MGRNILNGNSEREIDISELESGTYIVTVLNGSEIYSEKIIVK
jgi:hypothetical protein